MSEFLRFIPDDTDILICEGLEDADPQITRILVAKSSDFLAETFDVRGPQKNVIALTGIIANETKEHEKYPIFDCTQQDDVKLLADLIIENII